MSQIPSSTPGPDGTQPGTGSNPSLLPAIAAAPGTPPDDGRRRLELSVDRHLELRLYVSPQLLRWTTGALTSLGAGAWYITH
ncbi:hypothetical protein OHT68_48645 (plasmid) [Streptomyces canus]|uniref:hypothetical protein n=1 Tax=Streptomyces canus TaxID=58343 RepID=UPI002E2E6C90|nr:hypothetical protein [Streptomyces canus]